jgi:hypothetical protein
MRLVSSLKGFIQEMGAGFLSGPGGEKLAQDPKGFYEELIYLAYRCLVLLIFEAKAGLSETEGPHRFLRICEQEPPEDADLWDALKQIFASLRNPEPQGEKPPYAFLLGFPPTKSGLLGQKLRLEEPPFSVSNAHVLSAFRHIARDFDGQPIDYATLPPEELGFAYEELVGYIPQVTREKGDVFFRFAQSNGRKRSGTYYTPESLLKQTIGESLDAIIERRLNGAKKDPKDQEKALLSIKVLDPASGSGHFLLGAARRLGQVLAQIRTGKEEPSFEAYREAVRDVVRFCLYAVDKDPMAAELCKVSLWLESHVPGKPFLFLDHRIKVGNSLVGLFDPHVLIEGIPPEAYEPKIGDEKKAAQAARKANQAALERGLDLFFQFSLRDVESGSAGETIKELAQALEELANLPEDTYEQVAFKAKVCEALWGREY